VKVVLDPQICTGHGRCYALAPEVFAPDDLGHCAIVVAEPSPDQHDAARRAVASCPEEALRIEE
jgi:ferredoxin